MYLTQFCAKNAMIMGRTVCGYVFLVIFLLPRIYDCSEEMVQIKQIQLPMGSMKYLNCRTHHQPNHKFIWEYKSCKNGDFHLECDTDNSKWTQLDETGHKLRINKTNSSHNGLYRCTQNGNVLRIFSVEISGTESYPPPKVESLTWFSSNSSSLTEYTFLCNITSKPEPKVFWIKQCHGSICNLNYHNMCFCPMNITNDNALYNNDNTYLSKIKLINVREVDSGWYMCLAVTSFGKDFKNVTINVQSLNIPTPASYSLLFLIPFVFILSPAVIWLCYYYNRKKKKEKTNKTQQLLTPRL